MPSIARITDRPEINLALDTIRIQKQALVFCNTRRSAEAAAERIAKKTQMSLVDLSNQILNVLSSPTKQCKRLAYCVKKGTAFHHAGLAPKQRTIIEDAFKDGKLKVICSTPTLAAGINMPAFRTILTSLKRYGGRWGMQWIPALEYHQMAGRAGRPDFNDIFGEAICIAKNDEEAEELLKRYLHAPAEPIVSKLAVEPVLRTYCLSLVATEFCRSTDALVEFFSKTFYGHQYGDLDELEYKIKMMLSKLEEWGFLHVEDKLKATPMGQRVSELYLDPYTAHIIITSLRRATQKQVTTFSYLQLIASTLELRPLPRVGVREFEFFEAKTAEYEEDLIAFVPTMFDPEYDEFLKSIKLAVIFEEWMGEVGEDLLLEKYRMTPGELHMKRNNADWMLYATSELCTILGFTDLQNMIKKTRFRLDKGIKEELIPLVRLKNIGRVRARKLYRNKVRSVADVKQADVTKLVQILGKKTALSLKEQVGQKIDKIPKGKRKGQTSIEKF